MSEFRFSPRPNRASEIGWLPWSAGAFDRARREGKPILLSISAVWCHWCHVMDETTYSNDGVIDAIRTHFVPVRVDNDERPDVNARYNMGGWPTTAFLADDGTTLTGATYLPPEHMERALRDVAGWYARHRADIPALARPERSREPSLAHGALDPHSASRIVAAIASTYDEVYGGFGEAPKFPQPEMLETLLVESDATGDESLRAMVIRTLLAMAQGGMYDHVEGGFFRYSTTRDWSVPHFEKMAEDHAGLIRVLATLLARTSHEQLHDTLRSSVAYVTTVLLGTDGFLAGSQDADEEYYALPLEARREREAPFVDRTLYADRNAALGGALLAASAVLGDERVAAIATSVLDGLHDAMRDTAGLLYHVRRPGEPPSVRGLLGDQTAYLRALLDAHEISGEPRFIARAEALSERILEHFSASDGGFYDHAALEAELGRLHLRDRPIVENALLAESLLRLAELRAQEGDREVAQATLAVYVSSSLTAGSFAASYARALRRFLAPALSVRIVGAPSATAPLREAARRLPSPFLAVRTVDSRAAAAMQLPPDAPRAYVCKGETCGAPVADAAQMRAAYDAIA